MSFFEPDPITPLPDSNESPRNPSSEPPFDELPAIVATTALLASTDNVAVALMGARVFSDGVEFLIERRLRRGNMSSADFRRMTVDNRFSNDDEARAARLRYGLLMPDGERLASRRFWPRSDDDSELYEQHTLVTTGGGGGGSEFRYENHDGLWLHPLPPRGSLELVIQWPLAGIQETHTVVDGDLLLAALPDVGRLWER